MYRFHRHENFIIITKSFTARRGDYHCTYFNVTTVDKTMPEGGDEPSFYANDASLATYYIIREVMTG